MSVQRRWRKKTASSHTPNKWYSTYMTQPLQPVHLLVTHIVRQDMSGGLVSQHEPALLWPRPHGGRRGTHRVDVAAHGPADLEVLAAAAQGGDAARGILDLARVLGAVALHVRGHQLQVRRGRHIGPVEARDLACDRARQLRLQRALRMCHQPCCLGEHGRSHTLQALLLLQGRVRALVAGGRLWGEQADSLQLLANLLVVVMGMAGTVMVVLVVVGPVPQGVGGAPFQVAGGVAALWLVRRLKHISPRPPAVSAVAAAAVRVAAAASAGELGQRGREDDLLAIAVGLVVGPSRHQSVIG